MAPRQDDTINMTPEAVRLIADRIRTDAEASKGNINTLFAGTNVAVERHPGWLTTEALKKCGETWQQELLGLIDQSEQTAESLLSSAGLVNGMDDEARQRFGAVLSEMSTS
ncbi:hypothetical protein [Amycolatopsis sp.]|jgi:hypothetical protein|uniref:hypothetical protein n=1 Tax=Amycolatopsis sp. TaxID=37632 RepID=UPI002E07563C|nr:hypothetical protein [Amycolatopsis sp.]